MFVFPAPLELELELELELVVVFELEDVVDLCPEVGCAAGGVACPVVGTVSAGAPAVLSEPELPPHAASASATPTAARAAIKLRVRLL